MNFDRRVVGALVIVLLLGGATFGLLSWEAPSGGTAAANTAPATASQSSAPTASGPRTTTPPPPFTVRIDSVESCGNTCRDVTATLTNQQDQQATGVRVHTSIYAGDKASGDPIWEGSEDVGTLDAGGSSTDTQRIELGFMDAAAVQSKGGHITIVLVVKSDQRTMRHVERRDVS